MFWEDFQEFGAFLGFLEMIENSLRLLDDDLGDTRHKNALPKVGPRFTVKHARNLRVGDIWIDTSTEEMLPDRP
jgi:hypothetical protein